MKIVLVTSGSGGIGASVARQCAAKGMGVIVTYNSHPESALKVVKDIEASGGRACALPLDISRTETFGAFRNTLLNLLSVTWGQDYIDVLINNAGFGLFNPIEKVTESEFDSLFSVHLKGPFFLTQTLLSLICDGGHIVNVTSATTRVATAGVAPYVAFKGGLEVLTRYMAKEFGPRRIRANAVSPGAIRTSLGGGLKRLCSPHRPRWNAWASRTISDGLLRAWFPMTASGLMHNPLRLPAATKSEPFRRFYA